MNQQTKLTITIKDVARACGVSTQTISRVINNRQDVSSATREKVLAVIDQLGYQPSAMARGMRQGSKTLGVIITGLKYKGISTTLKGIVQEAEKQDLSIILKELATFDAKDMHPVIHSLLSHQVRGIIYAAPEVGDNWLHVNKNMSSSTPPIVFLKGNPASAPMTISTDNFHGAYLVTRHLIEQGYQKIAHISGPLDWWEARERRRGWQQALIDAGLSAEKYACIEGDWTSEKGLTAFRELKVQFSQMDAVFAANDQTALAVLHEAWSTGVSVPEKLGVAGYDNISESKYFTPALTTVRQDLHELGALAVRKILQTQKNKATSKETLPDTILLNPELVTRASTLRR
jgi:DNA-binding LacI/PurR family transcriptional regulator